MLRSVSNGRSLTELNATLSRDSTTMSQGRQPSEETRRISHSRVIRINVEADRRSERRICNQRDYLTPRNQHPYPYYYVTSVSVSPILFSFFAISFRPTRKRELAILLLDPLHHPFGYSCHWRSLIIPITAPDETRGKKTRNGQHGYITRDRSNAFFLRLDMPFWSLLITARKEHEFWLTKDRKVEKDS